MRGGYVSRLRRRTREGDRHILPGSQWFLPALIVTALGLSLSPGSAHAVMCDLTTAGSSCTINGASFFQADPQPTGSDQIAFVRISQAPALIVQGYNTDFRPVQFEEIKDSTHTHSLLLSSVPIVFLGGVPHRKFGLDINQIGAVLGSLLSLDKLQIFQSNSPTLHGYSDGGTTDRGSSGSFPSPPADPNTQAYNLDTDPAPMPPFLTDNWIKMDFRLNSGSGSGDMFAFIPNAMFNPLLSFVTLYSKFGINHANNDGYEEWFVEQPVAVSEPGTLLLLGSGLAVLGILRRKRFLIF